MEGHRHSETTVGTQEARESALHGLEPGVAVWKEGHIQIGNEGMQERILQRQIGVGGIGVSS